MLFWLRKHKWWVLCIAITTIILTSGSFVLTRGYRQVCQYKNSLIAKGEEIDWEKLIPKSPLEKENAAPQLDKLIRYFLPRPFIDIPLVAMQWYPQAKPAFVGKKIPLSILAGIVICGLIFKKNGKRNVGKSMHYVQ